MSEIILINVIICLLEEHSKGREWRSKEEIQCNTMSLVNSPVVGEYIQVCIIAKKYDTHGFGEEFTFKSALYFAKYEL